MVFQTMINSTARRIPLIKFRKGGLNLPGQSAPGQGPAGSAASTNLAKPSSVHSRPVIEDWELPPRYWRKPLSAAEMDYINRGGPA